MRDPLDRSAQRTPGMSARLKLTLSYAGFLMIAGALLLAVVWVFLLRYVPDLPGGAPTFGERLNGPVAYSPGRRDLLDAFAPKVALMLVFLLVFGLVGGWILAGRMLAPLSRITSAARKATAGSLSHRIELEGRGDEFRELADAFDTMLSRLEAHVAEQQRFAANASHELRTPLAVTQTLLEVARKDPGRDGRELVERLHDVNARAIELTEALLLLSRADRRTFAREDVDLSLVAEQAAETLLPLAEERGVVVETSGEVTRTVGSPALLQQLGTNLVHNAIVHNTESDGRVWVAVAADGDAVELVVQNTGVPLTAQQASRLVEPFLRGEGRLRSEHAGAGLGLAIAERIVEAHDGALVLTPREGGGLRVAVRLPAVPPA